MRTVTEILVRLALAPMLVVLVLSGPAAADLICPVAPTGVPFHGTMHGSETDTVHFPTVSVVGSGTGNATHLGRFDVSWLVTVDISTSPSPSTGTSEFVAANGDRLFTDIVGEGSGAPIANIVECNTITGGTGRFAGATGEFAFHRVVDLLTGATHGSFDGSIELHGSR